MNTANISAGEIHNALDAKLKDTGWSSGASEAHGLLSALACRGIAAERLPSKAWLLRMESREEMALLDGMYAIILRDLQCDDFAFQLLLPGDDDARRLECIADWCDGFVQGFFHDAWGDSRSPMMMQNSDAKVRESIADMMRISGLSAGAGEDFDGDGAARQLVEIEEYLRVAVQLIFEELNAGDTPP